MSENADKSRFLVFMLLLSFLLLSVVYLPVSVSGGTQAESARTDTAGGNTASFIINNVFDCLEAENLSFQISFNQAMLSKKPSDEKGAYLLAVLFSNICMLLISAFSYFEISGFRIPDKITDYMHAKDGMT